MSKTKALCLFCGQDAIYDFDDNIICINQDCSEYLLIEQESQTSKHCDSDYINDVRFGENNDY